MIQTLLFLLTFLLPHLPEDVFAETLLAGAAAVEITPIRSDGTLWQEPFTDLNGNKRYDPPRREQKTTGEPFTDQNKNGKWDGPYLAGFFHNSVYYTATGVHDPLWARVLVLQQGKTKLALVALDLVGFFYQDVLKIRTQLEDLGFTHVMVASTHTHGGVDVIGLWGPDFYTNGRDPRTIDWIVDQTVKAVRQAHGRLRSAHLTFGRAEPTTHYGQLVNDLRDPIVIDRTLWVMRVTDKEGAGIATLINWTPHPETVGNGSSLITSDFPHYLRQALEQGGFWVGGKRWSGLDGIPIYFSGAVGGLMTPLRISVLDEEGRVLPERSFGKAKRIGEIAAWTTLKALKNQGPSPIDGLEIRTKQVFLPFNSPFLRELYQRGVFDRETYNKGKKAGRKGSDLITEVGILSFLGPHGIVAQMAMVPGELFPEIAIGGFLSDPVNCWERTKRKRRLGGGGIERVGPAHPDVSTEPILRNHLKGKYIFIIGLANDEMGYIVPANDFVAPQLLPSLHFGKDRCGDDDHYEEMVSVSSEMAPRITKALMELLK